MNAVDAHERRVYRAARVARIVERLQRLDDDTLAALDRMTAEAVGGAGPGQRRSVTRRRFLRTTAAGGVIVAATGGLVLWQLGATSRAAAEATILQQIVALYDEMDAAGLDDEVEQGLTEVGAPLADLQSIAASLPPAVDAARSALLDFQSRFPSLQAGLQWLQENLSMLSQRMLGLENQVNEALGLSGPITETMGSFLAGVLEQLPETTADQARNGLERMGEAITVIPTLVQGLYTRILDPMENWFGNHAADSLNDRIVSPLLVTVLDPASTLAEGVLDLADTWEERLAAPARESIRQRQVTRERITVLRRSG